MIARPYAGLGWAGPVNYETGMSVADWAAVVESGALAAVCRAGKPDMAASKTAEVIATLM